MAELQQIPFDAPIPGQSFTSELGNRPWEKPPQYATIEDAIDFYMQRINEEDFKQPLLDVIELGMPLTSIANALQLSSVMEGKHTIDIGILVLPVIVELMSLMAENEGVKYTTGVEKKDNENYSDTEIALAVKKAKNTFKDVNTEDDMSIEDSEPVVEEEQPTGLMARRM